MCVYTDKKNYYLIVNVYTIVYDLKQQKGGVGSLSRECVYGSLRRKRHVRSLDAWSETR